MILVLVHPNVEPVLVHCPKAAEVVKTNLSVLVVVILVDYYAHFVTTDFAFDLEHL